MSRKRSAVLLAATVLAGCGGKESKPPSPAPAPSPSAQARPLPMAAPSSAVSLDPCQLLTRQEVETALRTPVGEGVPQKMTQAASCRWAAPSGLESANLSVTVYDAAPQARAAFQMAVKTNGYRPIRGLGQGAYTSPMYDLTVLIGPYELAVDVNIMQDDQVPVARRLAQQALARLPR
jgi:uncharacterized protein DUF3558